MESYGRAHDVKWLLNNTSSPLTQVNAENDDNK